MLTGDYAFSGTVSLLPNILTSPHAMERLLYLQAFMIFDAKSGYYTKREGLDSYELRYTLSGEGILEYEGKRYTGTSPFQYLLSVRIRQAKLLLNATDYSIEQVAAQTGFKDAGHFSQIFKKEVGITPLKYRKQTSHI